MINIMESDIFETSLNKGNELQSRILKILDGKSGAIILNTLLKTTLDTMLKVFKEPTTLAIVSAIRSGDILLVKLPVECMLPECVPFIKYKKNGKEKIIVNLTKYLIESKDSTTLEIEYGMDVKKLYTLTLSAYIYYKLIGKNTILPPAVIYNSAVIWARMFNKILNKVIALSTNKERYEAFTYFAMKFYMTYYLECPAIVVDNMLESYLKNGKTYLIEYMEEKITSLGLDPYKNFTSFCQTLFNNEVSNINKGVNISNIGETINTTSYVNKFISMYNLSAVGALCAFPFFMMVILDSFYQSQICNSLSLEDVVYHDKKEVPKLINAIYKELK